MILDTLHCPTAYCQHDMRLLASACSPIRIWHIISFGRPVTPALTAGWFIHVVPRAEDKFKLRVKEVIASRGGGSQVDVM